MALDNALLRMSARGAQGGFANAQARGLQQGYGLRQLQQGQDDRSAREQIAQAYAQGGPQAAARLAGQLGQFPQAVALGQQGYQRGQDTKRFDALQGYRDTQSDQWQKTFDATRQYRQDTLNAAKNKPYSKIGQSWTDEQAGRVPKGTTQKLVDAIGKSGTNIDINTGDTSNIEGELIKNLGKKMGVSWNAMADQGRKAAGMTREMEMLDELIQYAPQGPLTGRLAQAFPGVSNAGVAFESIVKRLAPQQRAEGSGSTSDIEFAGMLASMPALRNNPEANMLISGAVKRKSQIDMQMANVIEDYTTRKISFKDAQDALRELNNMSMMTPELHALVQGAVITKDQTKPESTKTINGVQYEKHNGQWFVRQ